MNEWPPDWFDLFWQTYPRRIAAKYARQCLDKVRKSNEVEFDKLIDAVKKFAAHVKGKDPQFIPHPSTWINQGRWDDELTPANAACDDPLWRVRKSYEETMARRKAQ